MNLSTMDGFDKYSRNFINLADIISSKSIIIWFLRFQEFSDLCLASTIKLSP